MSRKPSLSFLHETIGLLIKHFGVESVRNALPNSLNGPDETKDFRLRSHLEKPDRKPNLSIPISLEQLRRTDEEKYYLLRTFYMNLRDATVLPESQDIRQYARDIGLKEISGKSRKDLIPALMRFLLEKPTEQLRMDIGRASTVSEQQRKQGYSILTDKLLGDK